MSALAQAAASARWRPTALVAVSIVLHLVALAYAIAGPPGAGWWALTVVAANQVVLTALGLWPRSTLLGPNHTRLPEKAAARGEIAHTFDDGPDPEITPQVLALLERYNARATFFCIAERAERHPELVREIARRGHAVENHSRGHRATFAMLGLGGLRREIEAAQSTLAGLAGRPPRFFRPPAGLRNPLLDPVLHAMGLRLVSWTRRGFDTQRRDPAHVAGLLTRGLAAGDILLLHDGECARTDAGEPVAVAVLPRVLESAHARGLRPVTLVQAIDP
jgi:peptidoglycan/xylan/chitin deacetylase (PgdA/CDA1 family)